MKARTPDNNSISSNIWWIRGDRTSKSPCKKEKLAFIWLMNKLSKVQILSTCNETTNLKA